MTLLATLVISTVAWSAPAARVAAAPQAQSVPVVIDTAVGQDSTRYVFETVPERCNRLPQWDATADPPLSMGQARKAAESWLSLRNREIQTFDLAGMMLLRGARCGNGPSWHYRLTFDPTVGGRRLNGGGDFTVVVLFDASVLEPRVEPSSAAPAVTGLGGVSGGGAAGSTGGGETPIRIGPGMTAPRQTKNVKAVYPSAAQKARVQGMVIIEATIGPTGKIQDAKIMRSIPLLDKAALDAVRQWEFTPTLLNGKPVAVIMTVTVNFSVQ